MLSSSSLQANIDRILSSHPEVPGISIGLISNYNVDGFVSGKAHYSTREQMTVDHYLECASLSKTVATAFMSEYFRKKGISMNTSVNQLLRSENAGWCIEVEPLLLDKIPASKADEVTLAMLVNHTALGMHYVYGIPLSAEFPKAEDLLHGDHQEEYGYPALFLAKEPGSKMAYSGGGFIVLQYLLETIEQQSIEEIMRPFLDTNGMNDSSFNHHVPVGTPVAYGHFTTSKEVQPDDGGRFAFPLLAAGGLCTPCALATFLCRIARAYEAEAGSAANNEEWSISQETAQFMLGESNLQDLGAYTFMRALVGHGVFVTTAGSNKIMLHQAANEGFRGVYMVCFEGPDKGKGFVILCNGDNPAVMLQSEVARFLLGKDALNFSGVNFEKIASFDMTGIKQEQIVNLGLKELVLAGFEQKAIR